MKELQDLDVSWSMNGTADILAKKLATLDKNSPDQELLALIDTKLAEVEDYFERPLDSPDVYLSLRDIFSKLGNKEKADMYAKKAMIFEANEWEFKGRLQNFFGNNTIAVGFYQKAVDIVDDHELAVGGLVKAKRRVEKAQKGFDKLDKWAQERGTSDDWYKLGIAFCDLDKVEDGMACFERALNIDPESVEALCRKGTALESQGKFKEAAPLFAKALEIKPTALIAKRGRNYADYFLDNPDQFNM